MAREFNGSSSNYLNVGAAPVTDVPMTLACWAYPHNASTFGVLMSIGDANGNSEVLLGLAGNLAGDQAYVHSRNSAGSSASAYGGTYTTNSWQHVCGVLRTATDREVYLDGASKATNTLSSVLSGLDQFRIGFRAMLGANSPFDGYVAEAGVWDTDLSVAEIAALAKGVAPSLIRPSNLVGYWPIVRGLEDQFGGNTLSEVGSCPIQSHARVIYPSAKIYSFPSAGGGAYTLSGSSSISLTSSAGFTRNIHPSIAGDANVAVSPTGVLNYSQHPAISGSITQSITSSATMTYASGNEISGDVTLTVQPTATLDYNEHHVITGDSSIALSSSAAISYVNAGAYEISGSVTISATPSAALAYNQHPILSGDTTLYFVSAATMTYATPQEYLLSGASGIDVIPASLMSYVSILAAQYQGRRMTAKDRTRQMIATHKPRNMR